MTGKRAVQSTRHQFLLRFPRTTAVHHLVRITLIVDLAHREEYLIFIRVVENIIVHQLTFLIEEVETESPTLQFSNKVDMGVFKHTRL